MFALAALALGACTSDDIALNDSAGKAVEIGGSGYMSVAINLPTTASTRAANDAYDDGLPSEYAVHDATLLLFAGQSEAAATYYASYDLTTGFEMEPDNDNITSRSQITQEIDTPESGDIYALVVLNNNGLLTGISDGSATGSTATTLSSLQTTAQTLTNGASAMTSNGFFMCNAPLIDATGNQASSGTVSTLVKIDSDKIYHTAELAAEDPAAEIYVERGMAKVTMEDARTNTSVTIGDTELEVTLDGFALDLTNNVTYLVRNTTTTSAEGNESWWGMYNATTSAAANYRFPGGTIVDNNGLYRTYWAVDPNYSEAPYTTSTDADGNVTKTYTNMNYLTGLSFTGGLGDDHPQYCLENTFNVRHQNDDETTRAIVKATFAAEDGAADFYIWDKNHSVLYDYESIQSLILRALEGNEAIEEAVALYADENVDFYSHFTVSLSEVTDGSITEASDDATIVITIGTAFTADEFKAAEGEAEATVPTVCTQDGLAEVVATLNDVHTIGAYMGGETYYSVLIKHFGDDLTPWSDEYMDASATSENERSYPDNVQSATASANWLGRYGVLRNNWYDLSITSIAEPGSATPPEATGKPDDPTDLYISVRINILSWAKRTQEVTL